ncbi:hypothetical protein EQG49_03560 [Periweissella cryptocerci]|uniref:YfhO family protein n=1 Tax=Periweissella cryptocerci TaxID=2506420 RepID=A0A4P6YSD0_9LACO|nr:YfhO family protein [Periweissella cryptocerci]QBO35599.1 hypothetical protein EQG49_03560 [Periweissella cryptocerci]
MISFSKKQFTWKHLLFYSIMFIVLVGGMVFGQMKLGYTIVGMGDSVWQHLPIMGYLQQRLHSIGSAGALATWDWHLGLGTDVFQNFSYYVLGDPLAYLIGFFSTNHLLIGYEFIQILRFFLAGLSFMFLVSHYRFSPVKAVLSTMVYLFASFGIWAFEFQPFFLNALILLPLLIWSVERALQLKRFGWFSIIIALTLINNFYLALIMGLGTAVYTVVVYIFNYRVAGKEGLKLWLKLIGAAVVGLLMSAVMMLPVVTFMFGSGRVGSGITAAGLLFPLKYYLNLTMNMTGLASEGTLFWMPYYWIPVVGIVIAWVFTNPKKYKVAFTLYLIAFISALSPITTSIWNGTANPSDRWMFMVNALSAIMFIFVIDAVRDATKRQLKNFVRVYVILYAVGITAAMITSQTRATTLVLVSFAAIILLMIIGQRFFEKPQNVGRYLGIALVGLVILQLGLHVFIPGQRMWNNRMTVATSLKARLKDPTGFNKFFAKNLTDGKHVAFAKGFKYGGGSNTARNDLIARNNTVNTYFSTQLPGLTAIGRDMGITDFTYTRPLGSLGNRQVLFDTLGVKYVVTNIGRRSGLAGDHDVVRKNAHNRIILNQNAMPMAYVQSNVVTENEFNQLDSSGKELAYSQAAAISNTDGTTTLDAAMQVKPIVIPFKLTSKVASQVGDEINIDTLAGNGGIALNLDTHGLDKKQKYEYHIEVTNPKYVPATIMEKHNLLVKGIPDDSKSFKRGMVTNVVGRQNLMLKLMLATDTSYSLFAKGAQLKPVKMRQPGFESLSGYSKFESFTGNFGSPKNMPKVIKLGLKQIGKFSGNVQVVAVPVGKPLTNIAHKNDANAIRNLKLTSNRLAGTISAQKGTIMVTTIPYSDGWTAKINGANAKVVKVNNAFIGVKLNTTGDAAVTMRYASPRVLLGAKISLITAGLFFIWQIVVLVLKRRRKTTK